MGSPRRYWAWALGALLFAQVLGLSIFRIYDPDTWWHLKTGEVILTRHFIPKADIYSWTIQGKPWVPFEWLSQVFFYLAFKAGGAAALTSLKALVVAGAFLAVWSLGGDAFIGAVVLGLAAILTRGSFFERPQIFDFLLLPVFLKWTERKEADRTVLWGLPLLEVLWVNLHGGAALLGVGVAAARALQAALFERASFKRWSLAAALTLGAMLMNPSGPWIFQHLAATLNFPGKELIQEWARPESFVNMYGAFFALAAGAALARWRRDFVLCVVSAALVFLATRAVRHLSLAVLAVSPLLIRAFAAAAAPRQKGEAYAFEPGPFTLAFAVLALCGFSWSYAERLRTFNAHMYGFGTFEAPAGAADYLDKNGLQGRMFNEYGLGGYLIWREWPRRLVFIDGRNVEYGAELVRRAARWMAPGGFAALDRDYKFDYAVLVNGAEYDCWQLDRDPNWVLAYWDDAALVYLRRGGANEALARRDGYRLLQPNHIDYGYMNEAISDAKLSKSLLAELDRAVASSAQNLNAQLMKAYALAELGRRGEAREALERSARDFPYKPGPALSLGWFRERGGELAPAAEAYARAAELSRKTGDWIGRSVALNNLGSVEYKLGRGEDAARHWRESLAANPGFEQARRNLLKIGPKKPG